MTSNPIYHGLYVQQYLINGPFLANTIKYYVEKYSVGEQADEYLKDLLNRKQSEKNNKKRKLNHEELSEFEKKKNSLFFYAKKNNQVIKKMFFFPKDPNNCYDQYRDFIIINNENKYIHDLYDSSNESISVFIKKINKEDNIINKHINILIKRNNVMPKLVMMKLVDFVTNLDNKSFMCDTTEYNNQYISLISNFYESKNKDRERIKINSSGTIKINKKKYTIEQIVIFSDIKLVTNL